MIRNILNDYRSGVCTEDDALRDIKVVVNLMMYFGFVIGGIIAGLLVYFL
jgi:hypothetical protein